MDITVRPIAEDEIDRVPLRCWPNRETIAGLFARQGTIGIAAWEGGRCVGELHCYRVVLPDQMNEDWPQWNRPWWWPTASTALPHLVGPAWCHACIHVGRTLRSFHEETCELVFRFARGNDWDLDRTVRELNKLDGVSLSRDTVQRIMEDLRSSRRTTFQTTEPQYYGRGIATSLCRASIQWAREHEYIAVVAMGAPGGLFEFAKWSGHLPWTSYAKLGFDAVATEVPGAELPGWARGDSPPEVMSAVESALAAGRPAEDIRDRLMVLDLQAAQQQARAAGEDAAAQP